MKLGDRVALHHHVPCLDCHFCRHHAFAQCATYKRTGITAGFEPAGGGYAEYVRVMPFVLPGVVKIPAKNSFAEGALLEPVNTVLKAVRRLNLLPGDVVLVAGQGPIGLMFTRLLQLAGARVIATDLMPARLRLAKKFGANGPGQSLPIAIGPGRSCRSAMSHPGRADALRPAVPLSAPKRGEGGRRPGDVLNPHPPRHARPRPRRRRHCRSLRRNRAPVAGLAPRRRSTHALRPHQDAGQSSEPRPSTFDLDLASICVDEKDLLGSYSSDFTLQREVARLVFSRQLDVRKLISHSFPLEQTAAAVALASQPTEDSLKIIVEGTACHRP